jgi:hypothetical protein
MRANPARGDKLTFAMQVQHLQGGSVPESTGFSLDQH